jgi:hypothetical protein
VKAALYANLLLGTNFSKGSKPSLVCIDSIRWGEYEEWVLTDEADPDPETGVLTTRPEPQYICVEHGDQLPDCFDVDYENHSKKALLNPISTLLSSIGSSWSSVRTYGETESELSEFM